MQEGGSIFFFATDLILSAKQELMHFPVLKTGRQVGVGVGMGKSRGGGG